MMSAIIAVFLSVLSFNLQSYQHSDTRLTVMGLLIDNKLLHNQGQDSPNGSGKCLNLGGIPYRFGRGYGLESAPEVPSPLNLALPKYNGSQNPLRWS